MKEKGFIPIVILALVVILVGMGGVTYFVYSSKKPKEKPVPPLQENQYADWQEYINPKYGYSIKYPADWFFHKTGYNPPPPATIELSNVDEKLGLVGNEIRLEVSSLPAAGETLETDAEIQNLSGKSYSKKTITISGEPAAILEKVNHEGGVEILIYAYHKGNVYRFVWNLWNSEILRLYDGTLQKIINSFTFTD